jgi:hypothetical protein
MVKIIRITNEFEFDKAIKSVKRLSTRLPIMARELKRQLGNTIVKELKTSARQAGIRRFTNEMFTNGIRYEQTPKGNIGKVIILDKYYFLDSMKPHFVNVLRNRTQLLAWAKQAKNSEIRKKAKEVLANKRKKFSIYVKPHKYIRRGFIMARRQIPKLINKEKNKVLQT